MGILFKLILIALAKILREIAEAMFVSFVQSLATGLGTAVTAAGGTGAGAVNIIKNGLVGFFQTIGYAFIALIFLMEVIGKATDSKRFTLENVVAMLFRLMIAKMLVDNAFTVMQSMDLIAATFASGGLASHVSGYLAGISVNFADLLSLLLGGIIDIVLVLIYCLGLILVVMQVSILMFFRTMEMLIMMAVSPVALAMFASEGHKNTGKKFLLNFTALCLQGMIIVTVCSIWIAIFITSQSGLTGSIGLVENLTPFALMMIVGKSAAMARSLVGV